MSARGSTHALLGGQVQSFVADLTINSEFRERPFNLTAANGGNEPIVSDAAFRTGDRNKLGATIDYLIVVPRVSSDLDILAG